MVSARSSFGHALADSRSREVLQKHIPGIVASPMVEQLSDLSLGMIAHFSPALRDDATAREAFFLELSEIGDEAVSAPRATVAPPSSAYETDDVPRASARLITPSDVPRWGVIEVVLHGPRHGNPFVDVELHGVFRHGARELRAGGFYDGEGVYKIRLLADEEGEWDFRTSSSARSLDGIVGKVRVVAADSGSHGPVRVDGFHFRHADGTRYRPLGTTAYAWTHQHDALQEATLGTLRQQRFNKLRMCVFPKSYLYNTDEPDSFPFVGSLAEGFDHARFDVDYFRRLESRIIDLAAQGIETDLILFHPYDRWGFSDLGPAIDDLYVSYVVRRLAAFSNIWWALANEYDLVFSKTDDGWERLAEVVRANDPHGHLLSIHQCHRPWDNAREWVTHASMQRIDAYRTAETVTEWRDQWQKPVVVDECGYEGDIDQGWGNITGQEMTRRAWEGAVRGGYVGHGETYLNDRDELWWSKGGELVGSSPARLAFLDRLMSDSPSGAWEPMRSDWDLPWGGEAGTHLVAYFGFTQPRYRMVFLPEGRFTVDLIDTWEMTVQRLPEIAEGFVRVDMPGRQFMALRFILVTDQATGRQEI